jgi:antitoxin Phd
MDINTKQILTMTQANQNFSYAAKVASKNGRAIIFKNNKPLYMIIDISKGDYFELTDDEKIDVIAARILKKHRRAFEELAK